MKFSISRLVLAALATLSAPMSAAAADAPPEVLVEAAPLADDGRARPSPRATIIDESELGALGRPDVADALRLAPGVEVRRAGGPGQTTAVFIRGARSEDTLVLVDGVEANDAMSPARGFDFGALDAEDVERVEIYRGPQGPRFGAGSLGGVINVVSKRGAGPLTARLYGEAGSYDTLRAGVSARAAHGAFDWSTTASGLRTQGFSAADEAQGNAERDGVDRGALSALAGYAPSASGRIEALVRYADQRSDLDERGGPGGDDVNEQARSRQLLTALAARERFFEARLASSARISFAETSRWGSNPPDAGRADSREDRFLSEILKAETAHEYALTDADALRLGLDVRQESGAGDTESVTGGAPASSPFPRRTESVYGSSLIYRRDGEEWFGEAGARLDASSRGGASAPTGSAELGRRFLDLGTTVRASFGSSYREPSLYQLGSRYGNPGLQTERGQAFEAAVEQALGPRAKASVAWFRNRYDDLIDFDFASSRYVNVRAGEAMGWEFQAAYEASAALTLSSTLTLLDARNPDTGMRLLRRPDSTWATQAKWRAGRFQALGRWRWVGASDDLDPVTYGRTALGAYNALDASGSFQITPVWSATLRVENLLNQRYQEIAGYGTAGLSAYAGFSAQL